MDQKVIAFVDKTIVRITGLNLRGVKPFEIEQNLEARIGRPVRVIGVSGTDLKLDVYGLAPEEILRDEKGIIHALSLSDGIYATDVAKIEQADKAKLLSIEELENAPSSGCPKERLR
jgi:hypothetical protein